MKGKQIVAIDVGSSNVVIAVGSLLEDGIVDVMGVVSEPVGGITAGRVDNSEMVARAIATAKSKIEAQLNMHITEAYAGISGDFIRCVQVTDRVFPREESITRHDIEELDRRMQAVKLPDDREFILSFEPLRYMIDDKEVDEPCGAFANVLSATYNFILCDKKLRDRLAVCLKSQSITIKEFVPNAAISHLCVTNSEEIVDGVVVIDLGAHITDVSVLLKGKLRHMGSIPMGANDINNDISSLGINKYVEDLKIGYGSALSDRCDDDLIVFPQKYHIIAKNLLRRNLVIAIEARLAEIAEWVKGEIKEAKCGSRFRPAVILTGGGSQMRDIEELFKRELGYDDVRVVYPEYGVTPESQMAHLSTPAYATAVSLLLYGAKRGVCSVSMIPSSPRVVPPVQPPKPANMGGNTIPPVKVEPTKTPKAEEPKQEGNDSEPPVQPVAPVAPEQPGKITSAGGDVEDKKPSRWKKFFGNVAEKISNSMSSEGGDNDF